MKYFFLMAASAALLASCSSKPGYKIDGTVSNPALDGKYVYLCDLNSRNNAPMDSALVQNGKFAFQGVQDSPLVTLIKFNKTDLFPDGQKDRRDYGPGENAIFSAILVLENAPLQVKLDSVSTISGTPENDAFQAFINGIDNIRKESAYLDEKLAVYRELPAEEKEEVSNAYDGFMDKRIALAKEYINNNINKLSGGYTLQNFRYYMGEDEQIALADKADSTFKAAPGMSQLVSHLDVVKTVAVGKPFKDFAMNDTKGTERKLSDYVGKGNYVLIDFWASWCPPCRAEMPNLVEAYKQYHKKGFEIVGVSLDSKQENWEKGIKDLGITWPQLSDLKGWKNAGAALYGVNSIPATFLIDPQGKIIAKRLHGDELTEKLKEIYK